MIKFVTPITQTGKKKIILAGLWTETCIALPTVQAIHDGYEIYVAEDCCGDVSQLNHDNAMRRVIQAGQTGDHFSTRCSSGNAIGRSATP